MKIVEEPRTLRRFPVIMMMQTEEQWLLTDSAGGVIIMRRSIRNRFQALMRPKVVVIVNIFFDDSIQGTSLAPGARQVLSDL